MIKRFIANKNGIAYMRRIYTDLDVVLCVVCSAVCFSFITSLLLVGNTVTAESRTATASITVPEACTMTSHNDAPHTATLSPNTYSGASGSEYANGIGKTTLTAICNNDNGFAIYAIGFTGNSYDSENHNKLVGQSTNVAINTAVYTSGDTTSSWSMKVNKINDSTVSYNPQNMSILDSFDSWHIVPATYTKVAQYKASTGSSTTDTTLGAKVETTYAAYIASNQPADTYIGQVKYTMVHPYGEQPAQPQSSASGKICYYANTATAEGTMGCQNIASTVTLLASNFSRQGYGFAGWSDKFDYITNPEAHFYGPQEQLSIPDTSIYTGEGKGLSLYAVWVKSVGSLQDASKVSQLCGAGQGSLTAAPTDGTANLTSVSALTDQRDNETYAIARLSDDNCWMIENLRLEAEDTRTPEKQALAQGYGGSTTYGDFTGLADAEPAWANNITTANSLYYSGTQDGTASIDIGTGSNPAYRFPRYNHDNTNARATNPAPTSNSSAMYSYGNYYTWPAAIANTTAYATNNQSVENTSICPSGWHLPKGGRKANVAVSVFWKLSRTIIGADPTNFANDYFYYIGTPEGTDASNKMRAYPNNFVYSGYVSGGSVDYRGSNGVFWSSTANSSDYAYNLYLSSYNVDPGTDDSRKYYGGTVRCVAPGV